MRKYIKIEDDNDVVFGIQDILANRKRRINDNYFVQSNLLYKYYKLLKFDKIYQFISGQQLRVL